MIFGANQEWLKTLEFVKDSKQNSSPRGMAIKERLCHTTTFRMSYPVVYERKRKLSYTFMAAEALWILSGSNRLDFHPEIESKLKAYSDDGLFMAGAYGPRINEQIDWAIAKLESDRDTRQAVIEIWRPMPSESKDVPCTLSMQFLIRDNVLHLVVFMRSSDVWMGLPYDMFSFSCVAQLVAVIVGVKLGNCYITAGSSHLYERDYQKVNGVLYQPRVIPVIEAMPVHKPITFVLGKVMNSSNQNLALENLLTWREYEETS